MVQISVLNGFLMLQPLQHWKTLLLLTGQEVSLRRESVCVCVYAFYSASHLLRFILWPERLRLCKGFSYCFGVSLSLRKLLVLLVWNWLWMIIRLLAYCIVWFGAAKDNGPKTAKDVKLISAGRILENNKTVGDCKSPLCNLSGAQVTTMHVIIQPLVIQIGKT